MQLLKCAVGFHEVQLWDDAQTFILGGWRPLVVPILWPPNPKPWPHHWPPELEVLEPPLDLCKAMLVCLLFPR